MSDPSANDTSAGFLSAPPDSLRYRSVNDQPGETPALIASLLPPGGRLLDVGCGTGTISRMIVERLGCTLVGLEPHPDRAAAARSLGLEVHTAVLSADLIGQLGQFDAVLFADVLEHVPDPADLLLTARRFLRPGGCVVASIPNVAHWTVRIELMRGRFDYQPTGIMDATHLRWFTLQGVSRLFDAGGFRIDAERGSIGLWMSAYKRRPWSWLSPPRRERVLARLTRKFPSLFACQNVVRARVPSG